MGQFGNLISCAKEEMCLNTDCSPELIFPNTLISPMADFLHQKEFSSGWKWTLESHWKLTCAEEEIAFHGRTAPGAAAFARHLVLPYCRGIFEPKIL